MKKFTKVLARLKSSKPHHQSPDLPSQTAQSQTKRRRLHHVRRIVRPFFQVHFFILFFLTILILLSAFISITYITYANDIASKEKIMNLRNTGMIIYDKNSQVIYQEGNAHDYKLTPLSAISKNLVSATLAAEDVHFYEHNAISFTAMAGALIADLRHRDPYQYGGSTITQQLVRSSLLGQEKSYARKLREVFLAFEIERKFSKDEILEMYLNSVYYGAGAYGAQEAAHTYFNEDASQLMPAQAAFLAGLPNAPSYLTPYGGDKQAGIDRQHFIIDQELRYGMITAKQADQMKTDELVFAPQKPQIVVKAPHFALWVRDQILKKYSEDQVERSGYRVHTTLDLTTQKIAEDAVAKRVAALASYKTTNGALVAMDPKTGGVVAMVGSIDYNNDAIGGKFNVATDGTGRQPGSSFKPFVYVTAFENRQLTPASMLQDIPTDFGIYGGQDYKPKDYDGKYRGNVTVRRALSNSLNIPAVQTLKLVGVSTALDTAHRMGITTLQDPSRYGLSLVLGGGEVHLLDMVQGYSVFANNGKLQPYYAIDKVQDKYGNVIYDHSNDNPPAKQVVIPAAAYLITNILSDNNARSEEFGANSPLRLSRPAAAKTGTTDDFKDSWTMGYTPNLVAGAWVGNNDGTPMLGVAGALGGAYVWHDFMERSLASVPREDFTEPPGVIHSKSCQVVQTKEVQYLPDGTPYDHFDTKVLTTDDVFMQGTEPKGSCDQNATNSGQPQDTSAPIDNIQPIVNPTQPNPTPPQNNQPPNNQQGSLPVLLTNFRQPGSTIGNTKKRGRG